MQRQDPDPGQLLAGDVAIEAAEKLVAAADGEKRCVTLDGLAQLLRLAREVVRDERLLAVLPAADVVEVDLPDRNRVVHADRAQLEFVAAAGRPLREHGDVAAVGVDVEVVRIEVPDPDLHVAQ